MKIYVMVDIEGISGVYCREQVIPGENRFAEGRKFLTEDINACVAESRNRIERRYPNAFRTELGNEHEHIQYSTDPFNNQRAEQYVLYKLCKSRHCV